MIGRNRLMMGCGMCMCMGCRAGFGCDCQAVAWTPKSLFLTGEAGAWYDPSYRSSLFVDAAGTTPVTSDGDPVGKILDLSGNGNHWIQSISAARPTYRTNGGVHWISFDGVDDYMPYGATNFGGGSAFFAYGYDTNADAAGLMLSIHNMTSPCGGCFEQGSINTSVDSNMTTQNLWVDGVPTPLSTRGQLYTDISGAKVQIWEKTLPAGQYQYGVGKYHWSGSLYGLSGHLYGHVWRDRLTTAERDNLEAYLAKKMGVTL